MRQRTLFHPDCHVNVGDPLFSCGCGCPASRETCAGGHPGGPRAFYEEECRCDCADGVARNNCLNLVRRVTRFTFEGPELRAFETRIPFSEHVLGRSHVQLFLFTPGAVAPLSLRCAFRRPSP